MIKRQDAEEAIFFLAETDTEAAQKKRSMLAAEYKLKRVRNLLFIGATGTRDERMAKAETSKKYENATNDYLDAVVEYEEIRNQRATAELRFEAWRSINANRRQAGSI